MHKIFSFFVALGVFVGVVFFVRHVVVAQNMYGEVTVIDEAPLVITSDVSSSVITSEDVLTLTYTFKNPEESLGKLNVTLTDIVPVWAELVDDSVASDAPDFVNDMNAGVMTLTVPQGDSVTLDMKFVLANASQDPGVLEYGLTATYAVDVVAEEGDLTYTTVLQYASSVALVGEALDLSLDAAVSSAQVFYGDTVSFSYAVSSNEKVGLASELAILAQLPENFVYQWHTFSSESTLTTSEYDAEEGVLYIHNFLPGHGALLTVEAKYLGTLAETISQTSYLTHAYYFSGNYDADGNLVAVPSPVDFAVVDESTVSVTSLAVAPLPYALLPVEVPQMFDAGDVVHLSYHFSPTEEQYPDVARFTRMTFTVAIPQGFTPTAFDGWVSEVLFSDAQTSWTFDAASRELRVTSTHAAFSKFAEVLPKFELLVTLQSASDITDTTFSFPSELVLTSDILQNPTLPDQEFSTVLLLYRDAIAPLPPVVNEDGTIIAFDPDKENGGGSGDSSSGDAADSGSSSGGSSSGGSSGSGSSSSGGGGGSGSSTKSQKITYAVYIVNPDGSTRSSEESFSGYSMIDDEYGFVTFDDSGEDMDLNDVVVHVDSRECDEVEFYVQSVNASWHHEVGVAVFAGDTQLGNYVLFADDHLAGRKAHVLDFSSLLAKNVSCSSAKLLHEDGIKNGGCVTTCDTLATGYFLSLENPDGTRRKTYSTDTKITRHGNRWFTIAFEDGVDADFNDIVMDVDVSNCRDMRITGISVDASWHHALYGAFWYNNQQLSDKVLVGDTHTLVGKTVTIDADDELLICVAK